MLGLCSALPRSWWGCVTVWHIPQFHCRHFHAHWGAALSHRVCDCIPCVQLSKYVSTLHVTLAKLLGEEWVHKTKNTIYWACPAAAAQKPQLLHKKTEGERRHVERGAIPLICALWAFQGKAVGPACFIANASVTSKGTLRTSIIGFALHLLTSDPEEASETGGRAPERMLLVPFFMLI